MTIETDQDLQDIKELAIPAKRAAYSDRTAWLMAILAELAYTPFDEESDNQLLELAEDLAKMADKDAITERLTRFRKILAGLNEQHGDTESNLALKAALSIGGFELAGDRVIHNSITDTQAFVAVRPSETGIGMAVICFRGTKQIKDWLTNADISAHPVSDPKGGGYIGNMHKGFHEAYQSVHAEITARLKGHEDLPLYITGHSLGGALAVVATWYQKSSKLAACYTFGAPRVGDHRLLGRFKTPIYRIVNGPDPVPFVPPSAFVIDLSKSVLRLAASVFPFAGALDWAVGKLVRVQKFRHYGYMRYMTVVEPGPKGDYPGLRVEFALSSMQRLVRFVGLRRSGKATRIDKYHDISRYRDKLRAQAIRMNERD